MHLSYCQLIPAKASPVRGSFFLSITMARVKQTAVKSYAGGKSAALAAKKAVTKKKKSYVVVKKELEAPPASQATKARAKRK